MEWYLRFCLGLPCRPEDARAIRLNFPELLEGTSALDDFEFPYLYFRHRRRLAVGEFRDWFRDAPVRQTDARASFPAEDCPATTCPLRSPAANDSHSDGGGFVVDLIVGTGSGRRKPKAAFLDLVRRHHRNAVVKQVIITDPYFLSDTGEDGEGGGYINAVEYLEALSLSHDSRFVLATNPKPKRFSEEANQTFHRVVTDVFHNVSFRTYSSRCDCQERLYLVQDSRSGISGVFGPSLNALSSDAMVLMGEINDDKAVRALTEWFQ